MVVTPRRNTRSFRANALVDESLIDPGSSEKERGLTILFTLASTDWQTTRAIIIDIPGH